jgi:hypothetical protein
MCARAWVAVSCVNTHIHILCAYIHTCPSPFAFYGDFGKTDVNILSHYRHT